MYCTGWHANILPIKLSELFIDYLAKAETAVVIFHLYTRVLPANMYV